MNRIWFSLVVVLTFSIASCSKEGVVPTLSTPKEAYIGSQLRTNGYYSLKINDGSPRLINYLLYRDGTLLFGGSPLESNKALRETKYANGEWAAIVEPEKTFWGVFTVSGQDILFHQWYFRGTGTLASYKTTGIILSDSTFVMTATTREGFEDIPIEELYHYTAIAVKPDSTNQFLE